MSSQFDIKSWRQRKIPFFGNKPKTSNQDDVANKHDAVRQADLFNYQQSWRRLLNEKYVFQIGMSLSLCANMAMAYALVAMVQAYEPKMALLHLDDQKNRMYRIEPISPKYVDGVELLLEQFVMRYTKLLLEIDKISQSDRFAEVARSSDPTFIRKFLNLRKDAIDVALDDGVSRTIIVETVSKIDGVPNKQWQFGVDYRQIDYRNSEKIDERLGRAHILVTLRRQEKALADKYENPLGITVLDLAIKERK